MKISINKMEWDTKVVPVIKFVKGIKKQPNCEYIRFILDGHMLKIAATDSYIAYRAVIDDVVIDADEPITAPRIWYLSLNSVKSFTRHAANIILEFKDGVVMIYDDFKTAIYTSKVNIDINFPKVDNIMDERTVYANGPEKSLCLKITPSILNSVNALFAHHKTVIFEFPNEPERPIYAYVNNGEQEVLFMPCKR